MPFRTDDADFFSRAFRLCFWRRDEACGHRVLEESDRSFLSRWTLDCLTRSQEPTPGKARGLPREVVGCPASSGRRGSSVMLRRPWSPSLKTSFLWEPQSLKMTVYSQPSCFCRLTPTADLMATCIEASAGFIDDIRHSIVRVRRRASRSTRVPLSLRICGHWRSGLILRWVFSGQRAGTVWLSLSTVSQWALFLSTSIAHTARVRRRHQWTRIRGMKMCSDDYFQHNPY